MTSAAPRPGFADEELGELLDVIRGQIGGDDSVVKLQPVVPAELPAKLRRLTKTRRGLEFFSARLESARVLSVGDVS